MANNRTGHNSGQIKKLDRVNKALAKAIDLTGSTAHSEAVVGTDVFLIQTGSGNVPAKKVTAASMRTFMAGANTSIEVSDATSDQEFEIVFVTGSGAGQNLFVNDQTLRYNPASGSLTLTGSGDGIVKLNSSGSITTTSARILPSASTGYVLEVTGGLLATQHVTSSVLHAATYFQIGNLGVDGVVELDRTDMAKIDQITDGQGSANKALVLSTTRDIGNINNLTASVIKVDVLDVNTVNSITTTEQVLEISDKLIVAASDATSANANLGGLAIGTGSVFGRASGGGGASAAAHAAIHWSNTTSSLDVVISGSKVAHFASSSANGAVFNVTGSILASGSVSTIHGFTGEGNIKLPGATDTAIDPDNDHLFFRDNDGTVRRDSVLDVVKAGLNRVIVQHVFTLSSSAHSLTTASAGYPSSGSDGFVANVTSSALTIPVQTFSSDVITGSFEVYLNGQLQTRSGSVSSANTPYFDYFLQATGSSKTAVVFENLNSGLELDHDDVVIVKYIVR
jgi:hypothetical protein